VGRPRLSAAEALGYGGVMARPNPMAEAPSCRVTLSLMRMSRNTILRELRGGGAATTLAVHDVVANTYVAGILSADKHGNIVGKDDSTPRRRRFPICRNGMGQRGPIYHVPRRLSRHSKVHAAIEKSI